LGFSDQLAQAVKINTGKGNKKNKTAVGRQLTNNNIEEFKTLQSMESWNEVFNHSDVKLFLKGIYGYLSILF